MFCKFAAILIFSAVAAHSLCAQTSSSAAPSTSSAQAPNSPSGSLLYAQPQDAAPTKVSTQDRKSKEDWTTISAQKSGLPLADIGGPVLSRVEQPEYTRELVRLQWRSGDPIDIYVIRPKGVAKPPVILYLYNYTTDIDHFRDDGWCHRAVKDGFAAVGFVSALSGQRIHAPRPLKQWFISELQEALATSAHDVQMLISYLDSRKDLDTSRIGMFGQGSGGAIAVLAAAADPRISALDVVDPWGDWPDWLKDTKPIPEVERPQYLKAEFLQKVANLDPVNYLPTLKTKALRIEEDMEDPVTPASARNKLMAAAPKPEDVVRFKDLQAHADAYQVSGLAGWLRSQLQPASGSSETGSLNARTNDKTRSQAPASNTGH